MERTYAKDVKPGKNVMVRGWIVKIRNLGKLQFLTLRDRTGMVQVTLKKGDVPDKLFNHTSELIRESCITVEGEVKNSKMAHMGMEILPKKLELVSRSDAPLPIEIGGDSGKGKRFEFRYLDLRTTRNQAIFRIRNTVYKSLRKTFDELDFTEIHTPVIQAAGAEGGSSMFPLIFYQQGAFLRQSPQLYKQMMMASGMDRIWEIGPVFRAEEFHTRKHVSEISMVDCELAWIETEEDVLKVMEKLIHNVYKDVKKENRDDLKLLDVRLEVPELPFKRLTYDEVIKMLSKKTKLKPGDDIEDADEKVLGEILAKKGIEWYFIVKWPSEMKPFYIMMDGKLSRGFDMGCKGMEIASGGQREHRHSELVKIMKAKGLDPNKFEFYLGPFRYGMPPHGGFAFGGDRLVQQICNLPDIKEAVLFPRTPEHLIP